MQTTAATSTVGAAMAAGVGIAFASNLMNNLPAGLLAGSAVHASHVPDMVSSAVLIGVDQKRLTKMSINCEEECRARRSSTSILRHVGILDKNVGRDNPPIHINR